MKTYRIREWSDYQQHVNLMQSEYLLRRAYEMSLLPKWSRKFKVEGYSYTAGQTVKFHVDYVHQNQEGQPNWRESLLCPVSRLNNRMRAAVHLFEAECAPYTQSHIYIAEQVAPLYKFFTAHYPNVTGSEYLGEGFVPGVANSAGIRHEDLTNLSFKDESFDHFLSFDCFEHIPNYQKAFRESWRILLPGGILFFSVPFSVSSQVNIIRAQVLEDGTIKHFSEPEYHGDPMNKEGCLCYQYFGWEMLDELKEAGFQDAYGLLYWSKQFGYLGGEQVLFVGMK